MTTSSGYFISGTQVYAARIFVSVRRVSPSTPLVTVTTADQTEMKNMAWTSLVFNNR